MGKRTKDKTDDEIKRKIKRLEKELNTRQGLLPPISNQYEDREWNSPRSSPYNYEEEAELQGITRSPESPEVGVDQFPTYLESSPTRIDKESDANPNYTVLSDPTLCPVNAQNEEIIPEEIMEMLGEAKKSEETFGKNIPQGVSERLGKILMEGLAKEQKENLLTKVLIIPENFQLVKAPKLNPEVATVLTDPAKNRDKRLEKQQNQLGFGIAGLVNLTSELINNDLEKTTIIKRISEVNQILLDLHYEATMSRRRLIMPMLDQKFMTIVQNVKRDQFLFGENLGDNIKTTKSIESSSLQIKKSTNQLHPSTRRKTFTNSGNLRAPARHVGGPSYAQPSTSRYYPPPPPAPPARRPPATRRPPPPPPPRRPLDRTYSQDYRSRRR